MCGCWHSSSQRNVFIWFHSLFSPSLHVSESPLLKARPQHDAAITMLRGRGAIRWVMSCAQFLPDSELCFMAESSVSISSEHSSASFSPQEFLKGIFRCPYLCIAEWPLTAYIHRMMLRLRFAQQHLPWQPSAPRVGGLPPWASSFLAHWSALLNEVPEGAWAVPGFSHFPLYITAEILTQKLLDAFNSMTYSQLHLHYLFLQPRERISPDILLDLMSALKLLYDHDHKVLSHSSVFELLPQTIC